jgi:hypothetical protein
MFAAAKKQHFDTTAIEKLIIEVPNGVNISKLTLTEVLYSPTVGYTLVSIGHLDELGYSITFADGTCTIQDPKDDIVGQIPKSGRGLYHVVHPSNGHSANAAVETITVMELHKQMGHIAPSAAHRLTENGLVSGIKVDLSSGEPTFCESCVYAKATRKPIAKVWEGEHAKEFADEVHLQTYLQEPIL